MREACLYNNWSFCSNIFENLQGINEMNPLEFFGEVAVMSAHQEWGVEGRGMRALSQILSDVSLSYSLKHISTGEHSLHISWRSTHPLHLYFLFWWWRHQMETCSALLAFVRGIHRWLRGIHRPVTRGFDVFFDLRLNKRLSKQSRRRWFETPSRSLWRHCNVVPNTDPVIRAAVGYFGVQRVTLVQFWIGETGQIGRFRALWKEWPQIWHTALPWLPFLEINYFCTQRQFKFVVSDHP